MQNSQTYHIKHRYNYRSQQYNRLSICIESFVLSLSFNEVTGIYSDAYIRIILIRRYYQYHTIRFYHYFLGAEVILSHYPCTNIHLKGLNSLLPIYEQHQGCIFLSFYSFSFRYQVAYNICVGFRDLFGAIVKLLLHLELLIYSKPISFLVNSTNVHGIILYKCTSSHVALSLFLKLVAVKLQ